MPINEEHKDESKSICQMEPTFITPTTLDNIQEYTCSKCGKQTLSEALGDDEDIPKYCCNCGAKVARESLERRKR